MSKRSRKKKDALPAHSLRGASAGDRWMYRKDSETGELKGCPASVRLSEGMPDIESIYAALGTAGHWITYLARKHNKKASAFLGYTDEKEMRNPEGGSFVCDQEMVDGVQVFLDYVNSIPCDAAGYEEKVTYMEWVPGDGFGTADDIRISQKKRTVYVTDFKYGEGIKVYAPGNIQMLLYCLGVYEVYSPIYDFDTFKIAIVQPRLDHIDEWEVSTEDLLNWAENVVRPAEKWTRREDAPINPGSWCQFCRVRFRCKARIVWAIETTNFESAIIDNKGISEVLPLVPAIRSVCSDIESLALAEALKVPGSIPGHKVVAGRSNRRWADEVQAAKAMKRAGFKKEEVLESKLISVAEFEKIAGKDSEILNQDKDEGTVYVKKPPGKPTLVIATDKRPIYGLDVDEEFADFDEFDEFNEF